jgi:rsbT antagonist protein RsbS
MTSERIPILGLGGFLIVTLQGDVHDELAARLQDDLSMTIARSGARGVLLDISALDMVDSYMGRTLATIARVSRLLDARTVVVGMRPAVAMTLVELGLKLEGIHTALDIDSGMDWLRAGVDTEDRVHAHHAQ